MTKGIVYYSQLNKDPEMTKACQNHLRVATPGMKIVSVTDVPTDFGDINVVYESKGGGFEEMFDKILLGLEALDTDIVFMAEDDVLYHPSHFEFNPPKEDIFYYNEHYWFLRIEDGFCVNYNVSPLSGLVASREAMLTHFRERKEYIEEHGFTRRIGFEPFTHGRIKWKTWYDFELYKSREPNVDIAMDNNTWKRWKISQFRRKPTYWNESTYEAIPGWKNLPEIIAPFFGGKKKVTDTLSILIPARNEMFLGRTIESILENIEGDTNIIAVLDGYDTPVPDIPEDPRVIIIKNHEPVGQREATNQAARLSKAKYIAKTDAHCSFDKGFDRILMEDMQDDWTMVPIMRNLWAFDWECRKCGATKYQGPTPTECWKETCTSKDFKRVIVWEGKKNPQSTSYSFDSEPHFQYFREYKKRDEYKKALEKDKLTETMSLQGSFFMATREKYWELGLCDADTFGSWGSQGIEVAVKTWLSGGRVVVNHKTWYAHMFRTQGGDFSFPYKQHGSQVNHAKKTARKLFFDNEWDKQVRPLSWLLEKFWPIPGGSKSEHEWTEEKLKKLQDWAKKKDWPNI